MIATGSGHSVLWLLMGCCGRQGQEHQDGPGTCGRSLEELVKPEVSLEGEKGVNSRREVESPSHQREENEHAEAMVPDTGDTDEAGEAGAVDVGPRVPQEGPGLRESIGFSAEELSNQMCHLEEPFGAWLDGGQSAVGRPGGGCPVNPLEGV